MPLPKPKTSETKDEFMDRCMGDSVMLKEYPDEKQRYAVCETQWDDKGKKGAAPEVMERRDMPLVDLHVEARGEGDTGRKLVGYAAVFNSVTDIGWFREQIASGAFTDTIREDDVRGLFNHDSNMILGRNRAGTLALKEDRKGLRFEIDVPDTQIGRDVLTSVERGDVSGCSFAFMTQVDEWDHSDKKSPLRTLKKVRLFDVGPVTYPAYVDTSVAARSLEAAKAGKTDEKPPETARNEPKTGENTAESGEKPAETAPVVAEISHERGRDIRYAYEEMGRLINHVKEKNRSPEA